jgi:hypothetical protein
MAYRTTRPLELRAWDHRGMFGAGSTFTLPAGSHARLVKRLDGLRGDGFAAASIAQLVALTGNSHDPKYRYVPLPADAIEGETEAERAEVARVAGIASHFT